MQKQNRWRVLLLVAVIVLGYFWCKHRSSDAPVQPGAASYVPADAQPQSTASIETLTSEAVVVPYIKKTGQLPDCYITKQEARKRGWNPSEGNLCEALPGRAIGGDVFTNRQKALPVKSGRTWYEADLNYACGRRNADRMLFSSDRLVFVTKDHYQTFEEK
ncbi:ribonuclease [Niabella sp. CC-SYL272]|uniref:ribonuclease domain-containing protein n=1 Tax=Niabella agricola TaxID=2891571 RepID=UPI001F2DF804|nr:ribonuclease domain-containing protein [Niabella agricola]MCF3109820.1 ribonuclease [Niabella agricola]